MTYLAIFFATIVLLIVLMLARSGFMEDETSFRQAGVVVNYPQGTVSFKGKTFPVAKVRALRTVAGGGRYGNESTVWIDFDDMKTPTHRIDFIRADDSQKFALRFCQAIVKAGGPELS